jgi:hypothetical protein
MYVHMEVESFGHLPCHAGRQKLQKYTGISWNAPGSIVYVMYYILLDYNILDGPLGWNPL